MLPTQLNPALHATAGRRAIRPERRSLHALELARAVMTASQLLSNAQLGE